MSVDRFIDEEHTSEYAKTALTLFNHMIQDLSHENFVSADDNLRTYTDYVAQNTDVECERAREYLDGVPVLSLASIGDNVDKSDGFVPRNVGQATTCVCKIASKVMSDNDYPKFLASAFSDSNFFAYSTGYEASEEVYDNVALAVSENIKDTSVSSDAHWGFMDEHRPGAFAWYLVECQNEMVDQARSGAMNDTWKYAVERVSHNGLVGFFENHKSDINTGYARFLVERLDDEASFIDTRDMVTSMMGRAASCYMRDADTDAYSYCLAASLIMEEDPTLDFPFKGDAEEGSRWAENAYMTDEHSSYQIVCHTDANYMQFLNDNPDKNTPFKTMKYVDNILWSIDKAKYFYEENPDKIDEYRVEEMEDMVIANINELASMTRNYDFEFGAESGYDTAKYLLEHHPQFFDEHVDDEDLAGVLMSKDYVRAISDLTPRGGVFEMLHDKMAANRRRYAESMGRVSTLEVPDETPSVPEKSDTFECPY